MDDSVWRQLVQQQRGIVARRQLRALGIARHVIHGNVAAGRWVLRTDRVVSTFTGPLLFEHRLWLGALHAGGNALIGGLSAAAVHGLRRWDRPAVPVLVDDRLDLEPVPGIEFVRTRRDLRALRATNSDLPLCRIEPAALLFAGYCSSERTAQGLLAALRLANGHVVVLEVDGAFHMNVEQWEADIVRQRGLTRIGRSIVRCTTRELRVRPEVVFRDLVALGVAPGQTLAPGQSTA